MSFIRVVDAATLAEVDVNVANIVAFSPAIDGQNQPIDGTYIALRGGGVYHVKETPRQVRGFVRVATGNAPKTVTKSKPTPSVG